MLCAGCGTTRRTDTSRTATEQLLLSDAIDRSVSRIDFGLFAGKDVYLDNSYLGAAVDKEYITSTLRQHMLACGCILKDKKDEAAFVVEVRVGAVGTDRNDLLFGVPPTTVSLGALSPVPGTPTQVPEIAFAKRTDQMGVAKIAVFAYQRSTGEPVWQSGSDVIASRSRDLWIFGAGPFQRGSIYDGPQFAGGELRVPLVGDKNDQRPPVRVARERVLNPQTLSEPHQENDTSAAQVTASSSAGSDSSQVAAVPATAPATAAASQEAPPQNPAAGVVFEPPPQNTAASRSQFDPFWSDAPADRQGAAAVMADRRWPAAGTAR
jgi:hypothetical protein